MNKAYLEKLKTEFPGYYEFGTTIYTIPMTLHSMLTDLTKNNISQLYNTLVNTGEVTFSLPIFYRIMSSLKCSPQQYYEILKASKKGRLIVSSGKIDRKQASQSMRVMEEALLSFFDHTDISRLARLKDVFNAQWGNIRSYIEMTFDKHE